MDPGSIPGERIFFFMLVSVLRVAWHTPGKGRNIFIIRLVGLKLGTIPPLVPPVLLRAEPSYVCSLSHTTAEKKEIRATSDLEISIVAIYSLPLCQLSYTRTYETAATPIKQRRRFREAKAHTNQKSRCCCRLWGSNPRSYEHAP